MTTLKRRSLQIDDPLGPSRPTQPTRPSGELPAPTSLQTVESGHAGASERPSNVGRRGKQETASRPPTVEAQQPPEGKAADQPRGEVWRTWSGVAGVGSFRLPHELLIELGDTARELQLPIGMIVTAAIAELLDQTPDVIAALVDRADDARIQGRRRARRQRTESAGD